MDCADCTQCCSHNFDGCGESWHGIGDSATSGCIGIVGDVMLHAYTDTAKWRNSNADSATHAMNLRRTAFIKS